MTVATVEAIVNQALDHIGWPESVANIYDGSRQATVALRLYGQTRDALLRSKSWSFAQQQENLTQALALAPAGWPYIYVWPANCLLVRAILPVPLILPDYDPQNILFTPYQDATVGRTILTTILPAAALFTARVTDPTQMDVGFVETLISKLAAAMKAGLARDPNMFKEIEAEAEESLSTALGGSELQPPNDAVVNR